MTVLYPDRSGLGAKNLNPSAATIRRMLLPTGGPEQSDNGGLNLGRAYSGVSGLENCGRCFCG